MLNTYYRVIEEHIWSGERYWEAACVMVKARSQAACRSGKVTVCSLAATWLPKPAQAQQVRGLAINKQRLREVIGYLSSIQPPRSYRHPETLNAVATMLEQRLQAAGLEPKRQWFTVEGTEYCNVSAGIALDREERLIIGAHYDVCNELPGADDNASGVAAVLELARIIAPLGETLDYGFEFVFFVLEEPPFFGSEWMGSFHHAQALKVNGVKVKGMICLEMLGYFSDAPNSQRYPMQGMATEYGTSGNFIAIVGNEKSEVFVNQLVQRLEGDARHWAVIIAPSSVAGVDFSDHRNYWRFGYNAVMITDTAFYRNPNYHLATDTIETLDLVRMTAVVEELAYAVISLASELTQGTKTKK